MRFGTFIFQDPENTEEKPTGYIKQKEMEFAARNQHENIEPANTDFFLQSEHNINMAPMIFFFYSTKYYKISAKNFLKNLVGFRKQEIFMTAHVGTNESKSPLHPAAVLDGTIKKEAIGAKHFSSSLFSFLMTF